MENASEAGRGVSLSDQFSSTRTWYNISLRRIYYLWGSTALTQKPPRFNVHARVTCEIIRSNDAQCNAKE